MKHHIRYMKLGDEYFDPILLSKETERIVGKGNKRKYTGFIFDPQYQGVATGYAAGCSLRCVFCSGDWSRDYPDKLGTFYSPKEVFKKLSDIANKFGTKRLRISGAEPTICKPHLLELLEYVKNSDFQIFVLETNGILFGADREYVQEMSKFNKILRVRISLKAGTPYDFARKTGAIPESFDLQFEAIKNLIANKIKFNLGAVTDPRLMKRDERSLLFKKVESIDHNLVLKLQEETIEAYYPTLVRLQQAGFNWRQFLLPVPVVKLARRMLNPGTK